MPLLLGGAWTNPAPPTSVGVGGAAATIAARPSATGPHPQGAAGIPIPERYWFVASDLALTDGTVLAAQSWYSRGGSSEALIVNVAGHGPTYRAAVSTLNNQPALQFDVTVGQQMAAFTQNAFVGVNGATVFLAAYQTGVTGGGPMLFMASTATAGNDRLNIGAQTTTGRPQLLTRRLDADTLTTNTASSGGFQQASVIRATVDYFGNSGALYVNGSAVLSGVSVSSGGGGAVTSTTQNNGFFVGCSNDSTANSGGGFTGYIAEVIVYDRVLTADDIAVVEAYLTAKYVPGVPTNVSLTPTVALAFAGLTSATVTGQGAATLTPTIPVAPSVANTVTVTAQQVVGLTPTVPVSPSIPASADFTAVIGGALTNVSLTPTAPIAYAGQSTATVTGQQVVSLTPTTPVAFTGQTAATVTAQQVTSLAPTTPISPTGLRTATVTGQAVVSLTTTTPVAPSISPTVTVTGQGAALLTPTTPVSPSIGATVTVTAVSSGLSVSLTPTTPISPVMPTAATVTGQQVVSLTPAITPTIFIPQPATVTAQQNATLTPTRPIMLGGVLTVPFTAANAGGAGQLAIATPATGSLTIATPATGSLTVNPAITGSTLTVSAPASTTLTVANPATSTITTT